MRRILLLGILVMASSMAKGALGQPVITSEIAPTGKLRVAMNAGTPCCSCRHPTKR